MTTALRRAPQTQFEVMQNARGVDPSVEVLGFREFQMVRYLTTAERSPTLATLRDELNFCDEAGPHRVLERLERKGIVKRERRGRGQIIHLVVDNK